MEDNKDIPSVEVNALTAGQKVGNLSSMLCRRPHDVTLCSAASLHDAHKLNVTSWQVEK
jgi:hypothetical protein